MLKSSYLRWLVPGLMLLLAACGRAEAGNPALGEDSPAVVNLEVSTPAAPATQAAVAKIVAVTTEKPAVETVTPENRPALPTRTATQAPTATAGEVAAAPEATAAMAGDPVAPVEVTPANPTEPQEAAAVQPPTAEQQQLLASLPVIGTAPELFNEVWLNSEPLKLADLQGKVVVIEFWTFG